MEYHQLDVALVAKFMRGLPEMQNLFSSFEDLEIVEVGDGNLNFVYIVTNNRNRDETVVLKQAVPFLRIAGEGWPLSRERMKNEVMALKFHESLCPDNVPKIYYSSDEMSVVIMENLKNHQIIRGEIIKGKVFPNLAEHVSSFVATTLFHSSDLYLEHDQKKRDVAKTINIDLCKITEDFVFTHPYEDNETNEYNPGLSSDAIALIQRDPKLRSAVGEMKYAFMTKAEALLHGDLHIGSIMANEKETFIIDPEFSFYGPMGFDLGAMISNLFLAYFSHDYRQRKMGNNPEKYRSWLLQCAKDVWTKFEAKFLKLWRDHDTQTNVSFIGKDLDGTSAEAFRGVFMDRVFEDMIGFAACKMMRRIVGLAKVADIADIENETERARAEENALRMGATMILHRTNYSNFDELIELAKSISPVGGLK